MFTLWLARMSRPAGGSCPWTNRSTRNSSGTGFGAGDSHASISSLQRIPFENFFCRAYEDKSVQESLIKKSGLDWTICGPKF